MLTAAALILTASTSSLPLDDAVRLTPVAKGASAKVGYYSPKRVTFCADKPSSITKVPDGLTAPQYGTIPIGAGVAFIIHEPDGKPATLYVDSNGNGDLTDDTAAEWKGKETNKGDTVSTSYSGSAMVNIGEKDKPLMVSIAIYRFDKNDPARAAMKNTLLYYRDYVYEGEITIADKKYKAILSDEAARGDFRGVKQTKPDANGEIADATGVNLLVDVNGNGKFDKRGESFDTGKPFNIGGTTWEIADMARDGSSFRIVKSSKTVEAIPTPPDHAVGKTITPFETKDTEGKTVKFPGDYAGKIVLLDFWATWCGPCMIEMPNVVKAYGKHHDKGFEILGISLDSEKSIATMPDVMTKANMNWRQVADGKYWQAEIAQKYAISSIPATFLVDGTTGKILGANLRGKALDEAVEKALAGKEMK